MQVLHISMIFGCVSECGHLSNEIAERYNSTVGNELPVKKTGWREFYKSQMNYFKHMTRNSESHSGSSTNFQFSNSNLPTHTGIQKNGFFLFETEFDSTV